VAGLVHPEAAAEELDLQLDGREFSGHFPVNARRFSAAVA
jgi:hypothetical protein